MAKLAAVKKQTRVLKFNLELLARAITETWATDPTTPGLVCSFLPYEDTTQQFYVSVVRYNEAFGRGKRVVYSAKAASFDAAAREVAAKLVEPTATQQLAASLR